MLSTVCKMCVCLRTKRCGIDNVGYFVGLG